MTRGAIPRPARPSLGMVPEPRASAGGTHAARLVGRDAERSVLDRFVEAVRGGASRALVVRGEAGVGKTTLLGYLAGQANGCRVVSVAGVQSEMELAFAALHQVCAPMLDRLDAVPARQREALQITFGIDAGPVPDRFLVGLGSVEPAGRGGCGEAAGVPGG